MPIEQEKFKFNKENFNKDFKDTLKKYISTINELEHLDSYEKNKELDIVEEKKLNLEVDKLMNQLVSFSINALKLSEDKQEILEIISSAYLELDEDFKSQLWLEKEYFKKIILSLLKDTHPIQK